MVILGFQQIISTHGTANNYVAFQKAAAVLQCERSTIMWDMLEINIVLSLSQPNLEEIKERNNTKVLTIKIRKCVINNA